MVSTLTEDSIQSNLEAQKIVKIPNNGQYKEYYDDGGLYSIEYYENGKKEGVWRYYYQNGRLKNRITYKNNRLNGGIWHFGEGGALIFKENFNNDTLVSRKIINDSLYKYEVMFESHGREIFNKTCTPCHHQSIEQDLNFSLKDLELFIDTVGVVHLSIDSIHRLNMDSLHFEMLHEKETIGPQPNYILDKYDLEALIEFIEKEKERDEVKKKHRIRRVKERRKIVYLRKMTLEPPTA